MAMLAGPRRKQKVINLRAKNNDWSNDTNKFGQKMLEKMGWSAGKGLGAKENGIVDHVVARYKNDDRGLGYEDKNDQWTKHEDDFNALLANLSNGDHNDDKLHSGVSLEDKSKKSKARVHYHKFTRGKDLTKYSEKDLANIFGKKSLKNEEIPPEVLKDDVKTTEQVFTEKGSMEDYFKSKLAAYKSQSRFDYDDTHKNDDTVVDVGFRGFAGTNNDDTEAHPGFGFQSLPSYNDNINDTCSNDNTVTEDNTVEIIKKSKKKKKKNKQEDKERLIEDNSDSDNTENLVIDNQISPHQEENTKTKKKKSKNDAVQEEMVQSKKSKKIKQKDEPVVDSKKAKKKKQTLIEMVQETTEDYHIPKKKKKRKCEKPEN